MTTSHEEQHGRHPSFRQYVLVATILFLITIVEFVLIWPRANIVDELGASKIPLLVGLSAIKFAIVIMFYMHLKFESWLFSGVFLAGLALAFAVGIAVLALFVALDGGPRDFAEANRVAFEHGEDESTSSEAGATESTGQAGETGTGTSSAEAVTPQAETAVTQTAPAAAGPFTLDITTEGDALTFSTGTLTAQAGAEVVLTFNNVSAVNQHNWVLVNAGEKDAVATDGTAAGPGNGWLKPDDPRVIANTALLDPGATGEVQFTAPEAGTYQFVCTFPGHNVTMLGDFQVNP